MAPTIPGQDNIRQRRHRLAESLTEVYAAMPAPMRLLIEYKFFEPAFYATDLGDWGMSMLMAQKLGDRAQVLVDLGHHPLGTNIEQIVAILIDEGRLGGFHFNSKKYADDDLTVGSINPYELFLIFNELIDGALDPAVSMNVAYMIDQSHNIKPKIEATIQSVGEYPGGLRSGAAHRPRRSVRRAAERRRGDGGEHPAVGLPHRRAAVVDAGAPGNGIGDRPGGGLSRQRIL